MSKYGEEMNAVKNGNPTIVSRISSNAMAHRQTAYDLQGSKRYLDEVQRLCQTGSFSWDVESGEFNWHQETYRITGYERNIKPTLQLVFDRIHPEDRAFVRDMLDAKTRDNADLDFEHRLLLPDGSVKYVHVIARPTSDDLGKLLYIGALMDVTEAKVAENRIRQNEREFRQIVEAIPQQVFVLNSNGNPIYANQLALEYTGLTLENLQSIEFHKYLFHPEDEIRLREERFQKLLGNITFELEWRMLRKDGQYRWFLTRFNPLCDEQGNVLRWYATATDIEDRKQTEESVRRENIALREEVDNASMFEEIVGVSQPLQSVLSMVAKVAPLDSTVLINGETGTGKELIARAIHKRSTRSSRAFVAINCAVITQSLIASELFGHEKGSFTGAMQRRLGRFELADGGTIFLDEIGELPAEIQIALLRVLQEREFERVGGNQTIKVNVRVIAATNRDLQAAVAEGTFRSDLYYRLNIVPIEVPPLRMRKEDIPVLVKYFIDRYSKKMGKRVTSVSKSSMDLLRSYRWPGNIRELQNVIERSLILCETDSLTIDESWLVSAREPINDVYPHTLLGQLGSHEKEIIEKALAESEGRVSGSAGAASRLGIPASTLDRKIKLLKINKFHFKHSA